MKRRKNEKPFQHIKDAFMQASKGTTKSRSYSSLRKAQAIIDIAGSKLWNERFVSPSINQKEFIAGGILTEQYGLNKIRLSALRENPEKELLRTRTYNLRQDTIKLDKYEVLDGKLPVGDLRLNKILIENLKNENIIISPNKLYDLYNKGLITGSEFTIYLNKWKKETKFVDEKGYMRYQ